ncbi:hypothetical protein [Saccharopolyspora sp. 7B]|uniref:Cas10/Cmr2 second palm domain-containing protein n=1 Tax=Saccharopolyspora sp. 7B TaxID=2877240 RepID=UPI001CD21E54|nr:hypothetical protein [Saccharopolyspora sp. 7B]MCA1278260.1 hypothetical protein [Saccharopolyspora sp. 7B]
MNDYLDIGVVQIQSWLARTPRLRGRRGGSTLISQATDPDVIRSLLADLAPAVEINEEAGRIDGVVALRLHDGSRQADVERRVIGHLRKHMPGASLAVNWFHGETYSLARTNGTGDPEEWPAAAADWPAGRPCGWCDTWPASPDTVETSDADKNDGERRKPLCVECAARDEAAGRAERRELMPFPEARLLERLQDGEGGKPTGPGTVGVPDTFDVLAELDGSGETHLALVYADGNAIGQFIKSVQQNGMTLDFARVIDDATWNALVTAVHEIRRDGDALLPIVPHLVGGDDVLVSIPASRAWRFVDTLLDEFTRRIGTATGSEGADWLPTLSAGVVFHHYQLPLFQLNELAGTLLRRAKVHTRGEAASLAWQDTTRDGVGTSTRSALTRAEFNAHLEPLRELAALPKSARHRLFDLLRAHGEGSAELTAHAARVGCTEVLAPFHGPIRLADALGTVRWWWHEPA